MNRALRLAARVAAVAGVILAVLAVRVVSGSRHELQRGTQLLARGDEDAAILALRRAARLYAPGNPYSAEALERLLALGRAAEARGDLPAALAAYRAVRGAILGARGLTLPHRDVLAQADERIAALTVTAAGARGAGRTVEALRAQLEAPPGPRPGWTLLLLAGWLAWVAGAFAFAQRALDEEGRLLPRSARLWGTVLVVGFGSFVLGMALA